MYERIMKTGICALLTLGLTCGIALAQDGDAPREGKQKTAQDGERGPKGDKADKGDRKRHGEGKHHERSPRRMMKALFKDVDLTEDQREQVREIMGAGREEMEAWRDEHRDEMEDLRAQMREAHENKDKEQAAAVREKMQQLFESRPKPEDRADEIRQILTPEQTEQFDANLEQIKQKMQERREKMKERRSQGKEGKGKDGKSKKSPRGEKDKEDDSGDEQLEM